MCGYDDEARIEALRTELIKLRVQVAPPGAGWAGHVDEYCVTT